MVNKTISNEEQVLKDMERAKMLKSQPQHRDNFNIVPGRPLPEDFNNPVLGDPGHLCVDKSGNYQPEWHQLKISKNHQNQANPVVFPLAGNRYGVMLDVWCDVPPEVVISLEDAVEVEHRSNFDDSMVVLGQEVVTEEIRRPRFFWHEFKSA